MQNDFSKDEIVQIKTADDLLRRYDIFSVKEVSARNAEQIDEIKSIMDSLWPLPISKGGMGASSASEARNNLGINYSNLGVNTVSNGGTGLTSVPTGSFLVGSQNEQLGTYSPQEAAEIIMANAKAESLWSGSWASGSITVPNIENYSVLIVSLAGVMCVACKSDAHLWGSNVYPYSGYQYIRHWDASLSGETLTMIACGELRHSPGTGHTSAFTTKTVTQIWGVL